MAPTQTDTKTAPASGPKTDQPRAWNVVLLDDQEHSYAYVIAMMRELFAHSEQKAVEIAKRVDKDGRAVCLTTHKELAELKRDQVHAYGRDFRIAACKGSMSAIIEPADLDGDGDDADDKGRA